MSDVIEQGKSAVGIRNDVNALTLNKAPRLVPVGCNTDFPFQLSSAIVTAGQQVGFRTMHYFPKGGKGIRLLIPAGWYAVANETANTSAFPLKMSVENSSPPWDAATTYAAGDTVVYYATQAGSGTYQNNPFFTCVTANTNSPPKPGNANWTYGSRKQSWPVTSAGVQSCSATTVTLPAGSTVTQGFILSDVLPIEVPVGGWMAIYYHFICSGSQVFPTLGNPQPLALGTWFENGASVTDRTPQTGSVGLPRTAASPIFTPIAILGQPLVTTKTAVIIGDSIAHGISGGANLSAVSIVSGGTGYAVGDVLTLGRTGATAGAVAAGGDAQVIVDNVSSGVVTALRIINTGSYTSTASQTGQTLPTGTVATTGGTGTGCTVSATFATNPSDIGDQETGAQGWLRRGLSELGIPHATYAAPGDRLNLWTAAAAPSSTGRVATIAQYNADIAIVALGRNDLSASDSAATILANFTKLIAMLRGLGFSKVIGCTITMEVTSTAADGCSTLAAQTVTANDAARQTVNAAMRAGTTGFDAIIDDAALVEDGGASAPTGKWAIIGGLPSAADGKHPGVSAHIAMAGAVVAEMFV